MIASPRREYYRAYYETKCTPTYISWKLMLRRCNPSNADRYVYYAGRGIKVCDRWNPKLGGSFKNFLSDMGERPEGTTIDRRDNDGDYTPENCRWATIGQQNGNKRHGNRFVSPARS